MSNRETETATVAAGSQSLEAAPEPRLPALRTGQKNAEDLQPYKYFRQDSTRHAHTVLTAPEQVREAILWIGSFCVHRCSCSYAELAKIVQKQGFTTNTSDNYFYQLLTCRYFKKATGELKKHGDEALGRILKIEKSLRDYDQRIAASGRPAFVKTSQWHTIKELIDSCRVPDSVVKWGAIVAPTDIGKSRCFDHYFTTNNHTQVIHVECPAIRTPLDLMVKIGAEYNITDTLRRRQMEARIRENVNEMKTIILDNFQNLYDRTRKHDQPALNWLRELQDDTNCTLICSWTPWCQLGQDISNPGASAYEYLRQFFRRIGGAAEIIHIEKRIDEADVRLVAESFELAEVDYHLPRLVKLSNQAWGSYTPLFKVLQAGRRRATADGSKLIERDHLVYPHHN
jgi:hypothetical protein